MKRTKIKFLIPLVLLFMFIGFATVSSTLGINGDMELLSDLEDFSVYYSRALVNGVEDTSIIKSSTELDFGAALKTVGVDYVIEYDLTNASSAFDAQVSINCSASTEYFSINNEFDDSTPIGARQTRTGTMTLRKIQTVAGDEQNNTISCDIVATPVERTEEGSGEVPLPLENPYYIGREISIGDEKFNIISDDGDTISMLAQYNLGTDYKQSTTQNYLYFRYAEGGGWDFTPGPKEVELSVWADMLIGYIVGYEDYLHSLTSDTRLRVSLITVNQLSDLGCNTTSDYSANTYIDDRSCKVSPYNSWLSNDQNWWTKSAVSDYADSLWVVLSDGVLTDSTSDLGKHGVRPVITISKEIVDALIIYKTYDIGEEITIGSEKFNVISQTPTSVTMLAQYNLSTDYKQSEDVNLVTFATEYDWAYTPGPKEIDIQKYGEDVKIYLNNYVSYLNENYFVDVTGDFITVAELARLGCSVPLSYSNEGLGYGGYSCSNSDYSEWLVNGQSWWTRSASVDYPSGVWTVFSEGLVYYTVVGDPESDNGVRPTITISKEFLQ